MTIDIVATMEEKIKKTELAVMATIIVLAAFYILAGVVPLNKLWGFNHLKYHFRNRRICFYILKRVACNSLVKNLSFFGKL